MCEPRISRSFSVVLGLPAAFDALQIRHQQTALVAETACGCPHSADERHRDGVAPDWCDLEPLACPFAVAVPQTLKDELADVEAERLPEATAREHGAFVIIVADVVGPVGGFVGGDACGECTTKRATLVALVRVVRLLYYVGSSTFGGMSDSIGTEIQAGSLFLGKVRFRAAVKAAFQTSSPGNRKRYATAIFFPLISTAPFTSSWRGSPEGLIASSDRKK